MPVSNDDRIAAALFRLEKAELLLSETRKIFSYAEKQTDNRRTEMARGTDTSQRADRAAPGVDGLYPGQIRDLSLVADEEEEIEECIE